MRLVKARVRGYRSIIDTGYFEVERNKTIMVGPNEAGKTVILQALQKLNPPEGTPPFDPLRDYPRAKYNADIVNGGIDPKEFTVVEGHFKLDDEDKEDIPEEFWDITYVFSRQLDNSTKYRIDGGPNKLTFGAVEKDLRRIGIHFDTVYGQEHPDADGAKLPSAKLNAVVDGLAPENILDEKNAQDLMSWLEDNLKYLDEDEEKENERYDELKAKLRTLIVYKSVLTACCDKLPKFILFSNYFRIRPSLHLGKLAERIEKKTLDDDQYDYGNICLLKFLGFTAKELAEAGDTSRFRTLDPSQLDQLKAQLDKRDLLQFN